MSSLLLKPFELRGEFAGFIRTVQGKRRMVLRSEGKDWLLKIPKELRHHLTSTLSDGCQLTVVGDELLEAGEQTPKRVVSSVQLLTATGDTVPLHCPIRVCNKKNCWRSGGKQLWHALEDSLARHGLAESITLEAVDCLDHCKRGPAVEWEGQEFLRCSTEDAETIVAAILAKVRNS